VQSLAFKVGPTEKDQIKINTEMRRGVSKESALTPALSPGEGGLVRLGSSL